MCLPYALSQDAIRQLLPANGSLNQERGCKIWEMGDPAQVKETKGLSRVMGEEIPDDSCVEGQGSNGPSMDWSSKGSRKVSRRSGNERFPNMVVLRGILDCFRRIWHKLLTSTQKTEWKNNSVVYLTKNNC